MSKKANYRFTVGTEVLCFVGDEGWAKGTIVALDWREKGWPAGKVAPYQVDLGRGRLIFVPADVPELCKRYSPPQWVQALMAEDMKKLKHSTAKNRDEKDDFGMTPLLASLYRGWHEGALYLIGQRADPQQAAGADKATPLHLAVMPLSSLSFTDADDDGVMFSRDDNGVISATLDKSGEPLDAIEDERITSISYDEQEGKLSWVCDLEDGDTWAILTEPLKVWVPVRLATMLQGTSVKTCGLPKAVSCMSVVKALLQARADVNAQNEDPDNDLENFTSTTYSGLEQRQHRSPLHYAAEAGEAGLCAALIQVGANINLEDRFKMTALDLGLESGSKLVVDILLRKGADPNRGNMNRGLQQTCLHQLSDIGNVELVKLMIQHGAKINLAGKQGMSPLHFAARKKHLEVVEVLLNAGADVGLLDASGRSPGHYAKVNGNAELCEALADDVHLNDRVAILKNAQTEKERKQRELELTLALIDGGG